MPAIVIFGLIFAAVIIVSWWRIFTRLGMPTVLALLMPIPFGSTAVLLYTAFSRWPIEDKLESLQTDLERLRGEL